MKIDLIKKWERNKHKLDNFFRTNKQSEFSNYKSIVKKIFQLCINDDGVGAKWDFDNMVVIDHGDYQGTQLFIVPLRTYQPGVADYLITHTYYGSCSGCDTLQAICSYSDGLPDNNQVKEYMTLSLHLVQRMKCIGDLYNDKIYFEN